MFETVAGLQSLNTGLFQDSLGIFILISLIWSLIWKGFALWHASQERSKTWFIIILITNTLGILEILYLFIFRKSCRLKRMSKEDVAKVAEEFKSSEQTETPKDATV